MDNIFFGVPSFDRRIDWECCSAIHKMLAKYGGQSYCHMGISDIALARNIVVQRFLKSNCEWLMMVDSDIIFTEQDFDYLWEGVETIVTAPYARKIPGASPAMFGLGFTRVHRNVFEAIQNLQRDDDSTGPIEVAHRFYMDGEIHTNFFPGGVTSDSRWLGEDRGFFTLCAMTGIPPRIEYRARLRHVGFFIYGYPQQDGGAEFWKPEPNPDAPELQEGFDKPVQVM